MRRALSADQLRFLVNAGPKENIAFIAHGFLLDDTETGLLPGHERPLLIELQVSQR